MNNYLISKPSTFLDAIGLQRLHDAQDKYANNDIQTQAELYQLYTMVHRSHWERLGKAICGNWTLVKEEPFIAEKHNAAVNAINMDLNVLYTEYPKILGTLKDNFNYNNIANECLKNRITVANNSISSIPAPATIKTQTHNASVVIVDPLNDKSKIDINSTTADVSGGIASLSMQATPFDLTDLAKATIVNPTRFMIGSFYHSGGDSNSLIAGIEGLTDYAEVMGLTGIESNGFPGSTHEGTVAYGVSTDSNGNSGMATYIEPISGSDIHTNIGSVIDSNANTWYECEICNVEEEVLRTLDQYGWNFAKPYDYIRWATGPKTGETLKLAVHIKLKKEVPINQIAVRLHNTKPKPANLDAVMCKSSSTQWALIDYNSTSGSSEDTTTNLPSGLINTTSTGTIETTSTSSSPGLTEGVGAMKSSKAISSSPGTGSPSGHYDTTSNWPSSTHDYSGTSTTGSPTVTDGTNTTGGTHTPDSNTTEIDETVADSYYKPYTSQSFAATGKIPSWVQSKLTLSNQAVSVDNENDVTSYAYKFDNTYINELMIVLSQTQSYECSIIHRYYMHTWTEQTTTQDSHTTGGPNALGTGDDPQTTSTVTTTQENKSKRESGDGIPLGIIFNGQTGGSNATQGTDSLGTIGSAISSVGMGLGMLGIGGLACPILLGVGAIVSLFAGTPDSSSTTTSTGTINDQHVTGLELVGPPNFDAWRYAIGIADVSLYSNNYATSATVVSNTFSVPFDIKQVSISVTQLVPRTYPTGNWFMHYISIDGGTTYLPITPKNYPPNNADSPTIYLVNPTTTSNRQPYGAKTITTNTDSKSTTTVQSIKYKCVISRPAEVPYHTPALDNYSIHVSGVYTI